MTAVLVGSTGLRENSHRPATGKGEGQGQGTSRLIFYTMCFETRSRHESCLGTTKKPVPQLPGWCYG
jgi:hypothetical protein